MERRSGEMERRRGEMERRRGEMERRRGEMERRRGEMERRRGEMECRRGEMERRRGELRRWRDEPFRRERCAASRPSLEEGSGRQERRGDLSLEDAGLEAGGIVDIGLERSRLACFL